jgi:NADH-quinone oxidoreductase subunit C
MNIKHFSIIITSKVMSKLTHEGVEGKLRSQFGDAVIAVSTPYDLLTVEVAAEKITDIIGWLKNEKELQVAYLTNLGAVHYPDDKGREMAVVYHLHSLVNNYRIRLKVFLPMENPEIHTITEIYAGANWMERETYDFYGVIFNGHPDLRRILNEDSMDYFPLRKEYHLEDATREDKDDRFFGR